MSALNAANAAGEAPIAPTGKGAVLAGRLLSGLVVAFMLFDAIGKFAKPQPVLEGMAKVGFGPELCVGLGVTLLVSTLLYAFPRSAFLGAILLTGYLGGAIAANVRVNLGAFPIVFAAIFGILVWAGLYLRDSRLRALLPLRQRSTL